MSVAPVKLLKKSYVVRFVAWVLVHNFVDLLAMALPLRRTRSDRKRVLFVKLDGVGDYIIWTAAFEARTTWGLCAARDAVSRRAEPRPLRLSCSQSRRIA